MNVSAMVCEVSCWRFSLDDDPWSGGPVEIRSDHIETVVESNQHSTTQETADILKMSKSIKLPVKMKNVPYFTEKNLNGHFHQPNILYCCWNKFL